MKSPITQNQKLEYVLYRVHRLSEEWVVGVWPSSVDLQSNQTMITVNIFFHVPREWKNLNKIWCVKSLDDVVVSLQVICNKHEQKASKGEIALTRISPFIENSAFILDLASPIPLCLFGPKTEQTNNKLT